LPNIPTHPPVTGTLPTTPRIDPGRIGGLPNIPTHPPVTGTLPPLQPPPGGINLCQIQPSACNRPPVVGNPPGGNPPGNNPPGNNPPTNPPGNPPVVGNPPGGNPPGGTPPGGGNHGGHGHHNYYPYLGFGLGIGAALAAPTVVEYVTQPVYQPVYAAPADNQAIYGQPTAPNAPVASPSPIDEFLARLNGLNAAMRQGLITKDEYRSQRQAVLASLDAGQVSRSIGIEQGLRHLKSMAETGLLGGKEYDDKRKEFVLFL
jgi:hypothetical protein